MIERWDTLLNKREACSPPHVIHKRKQSQTVIYDLDNVDFIPSNVQSSHQEALLYVFEENEAVIKMIIKGRSPTMRHVSRTHRVALDWLFDRINLDSNIPIKYIDTKNQLEESFSFVQYHPFQLHLLYQEFQLDKLLHNGEEDSKSKGDRVVSKSRPAVMNMSSYFIATSSSAASSPIASGSPVMSVASRKPDSRMRMNQNSMDAASTSQVRLKDAYLGGLMEEQRQDPSRQEEEDS